MRFLFRVGSEDLCEMANVFPWKAIDPPIKIYFKKGKPNTQKNENIWRKNNKALQLHPWFQGPPHLKHCILRCLTNAASDDMLLAVARTAETFSSNERQPFNDRTKASNSCFKPLPNRKHAYGPPLTHFCCPYSSATKAASSASPVLSSTLRPVKASSFSLPTSEVSPPNQAPGRSFIFCSRSDSSN